MASVRLMTYNVHGCAGIDGERDIERTARVIRDTGADVVALQELDVGRERSGGIDQPRRLAELLGYDVHFTSARACSPGEYGNAILSRLPYAIFSEGVLPSRGGERRAVQWLRFRLGDVSLDVLNTHLGLREGERWLQVAALVSAEWLSHVDRSAATVVCGDFNAGPASRVYRRLTEDLRDAQALAQSRCRTWPSFWPILRLDHVLVGPFVAVKRCYAPNSRVVRRASDHLPLVVDLEISPGEAAPA